MDGNVENFTFPMIGRNELKADSEENESIGMKRIQKKPHGIALLLFGLKSANALI